MNEGFKQEIRRQVGTVAVDGNRAADVASWLIAALEDEIDPAVAEERGRFRDFAKLLSSNPTLLDPEVEFLSSFWIAAAHEAISVKAWRNFVELITKEEPPQPEPKCTCVPGHVPAYNATFCPVHSNKGE